MRPFQRTQGFFQCFRGRGAAAAVLIARTVGEQVGGVRIEHRGAVIDRRIDESMLGRGVAPGRHQAGFDGERIVRRDWMVGSSLRHIGS